MKAKLQIMIVLFLVLGCWQTVLAQTPSYSGVIVLKDGTQIEFSRFEFKGENEPVDYWVRGRIGKQQVRYHLHELKRVVFADAETASYTADSKGDIIIEGKTGKQVTVVDAYLGRNNEGDTGTLVYRFLDPVTSESRHEAQRIYKAV